MQQAGTAPFAWPFLSAAAGHRQGEGAVSPQEQQGLHRSPQSAGDTGGSAPSSAKCYKILSKEVEVMVD